MKSIANILCPALACLATALLAACGTPKTARSAAGKATSAEVARQPDYGRQRRFDALFLEAIRQREREAYDAEYELLSAALDIHPDAPEALYEMALLKLSLTGMADSLHRAEGDSLLRRAVKLAPDCLHYKETLAGQLARRGNYPEAIAIYEELAAGRPTVETLSVLVSLQEEAADYAGAIRTIGRLEQLEGRNEAYSIEKFRVFTMMNDKANAYAAIEELCAEYPSDLRYRVLLGDLYQQNGYDEMALAVYRDVLTLEPDNSYAQISLLAYYKKNGEDSLYNALVEEVVLNPATQNEAKVEAMRGYIADNLSREADSTQVLRLFDRVLRQPQENRALAELCAYYITALGMPEAELAPVMRKILEVEPDYSRARLQLLNILIHEENMEGVTALCREGRIYEPSQLLYYYYEGLALLTLERPGEAVGVLKSGVERIGDDTPRPMASDLHAALGDVLHETGEKEEAYAAYEAACDYNGENLMCLNNYAYFLALDGERLDRAEALSRRTIEGEPSNSTFLDTYAWILYRQRQYTQARIYIDEALKYCEDTAVSATLFDHAGDIYYRAGERVRAVQFWIKALGLSADKKQQAALRLKIKRKRL